MTYDSVNSEGIGLPMILLKSQLRDFINGFQYYGLLWMSAYYQCTEQFLNWTVLSLCDFGIINK